MRFHPDYVDDEDDDVIEDNKDDSKNDDKKLMVKFFWNESTGKPLTKDQGPSLCNAVKWTFRRD